VTDAVSTLARVCLPRSELRRALRIALFPPEDVPGEWAAWQSDAIPAEAALRNPALRLRRLFTLIDANLRAGRVPLDIAIKAYLRMGAAHEKMRRERVDRAFQSALAAVDQKIEFLVLRGMALSISIYPRPFFRHCHDLDLLVRPAHADNAAHLLAEAGFRPVRCAARVRCRIAPDGAPDRVSRVRLVRLAPWNRSEDWFAHSRGPEPREHTVRGLQGRRLGCHSMPRPHRSDRSGCRCIDPPGGPSEGAF